MKRNADENAWNAHLAAAAGKPYVFTGDNRFLKPYFAPMDELARNILRSAALPRSPSFPRMESWVRFFYTHAYASIVEN